MEVLYQLDDLGNFNGETGVTFAGVVRATIEECHPVPIDAKFYEGGRKGWPLLETGHPLPKFRME